MKLCVSEDDDSLCDKTDAIINKKKKNQCWELQEGNVS